MFCYFLAHALAEYPGHTWLLFAISISGLSFWNYRLFFFAEICWLY